MSFNNEFTVYYTIDISQNDVEDKNDTDFIEHVKKFIKDKLSTLYSSDTNRLYIKKDNTTVINNLNELLKKDSLEDRKEFSKKIALRLLEKEQTVQKRILRLNQKVQRGGLIISHFENNGENFICIIKVHYIDFYEESTFEENTGLPKKDVVLKTCINKLDNNQLSNNFYLSDSTKTKGEEGARFWWDDFLELKTQFTDKDNTKKSFEKFDELLKKDFYNENKEDYWYLRNNLVSYYQTEEQFKINDLIDRTMGNLDLNILENKDQDEKDIYENKLKEKFQSLSHNKNGKRLFDTEFIIDSKEIKARIKRKIPLIPNVNLEINGKIENIKNAIITGKDESQNQRKFIKIYTENGYDTFTNKIMSILTKLDFLSPLDTETEENFSMYSERFKVSRDKLINIYDNQNFIKIFNSIVSTDTTQICIDDAYNDSKITFNNINDLDTCFDDFDIDIQDENSNFIIRIEIEKEINNATINIYSFKTFCNWITTNNNIDSLFSKLQILNNINESICFHILDEDNHCFYSDKFIFYSNINNIKNIINNYPNKKKLLIKQKEHCHFADMSIVEFIPNDFKLIEYSSKQSINELFDKICFLLTLTFIADISEIQKDNLNKLFYKIHGYKSVNDILDFNSIDTNSLEEYYKIYNWIYINDSNSSISDKLGIARNLITLHLQDNKFCQLDNNTYNSIESNYKIYLKENVQQYLEVKKQVSSFIYDMSMKAENYTYTFMDTFKTNFLIFISYFISIIIVTAIDKGKFINIFSTEVTVITLMMLFISWYYKKITIDDINAKIGRFKSRYKLLKKRYKDILEDDNLKELFSNDEEYNNDIDYMTNNLDNITKLWDRTIWSFSFIAIFFCVIHDTNNLIEYIFKIIY
jgi:hypothetical protein